MKKKWIWTTLGIIGIFGGAIEVLSPIGVDILGMLPYAKVIQFVAGGATIVYIANKLMK